MANLSTLLKAFKTVLLLVEIYTKSAAEEEKKNRSNMFSEAYQKSLQQRVAA